MPTIHTVNRFFPFLIALFCVSVFAPLTAHGAVLIQDSYSDFTWNMPTNTASPPYLSSNAYNLLNDNQAISAGQAGVATGFAIYTPGHASDFISWELAGNGSSGFGITECTVPQTLGAGGIGCSGTWNFYSFVSGNTVTASADNNYVIITLFAPPTLVTGRYYAISIGTGGSTSGGYANIVLGGTQSGTCRTNWSMGGSGGGQVDCPNTFTHAWAQVFGTAFVPPGPSCDGYSHICGFTPENGTTVSGPNVDFTLDYFVTQADIDQNLNDVVITLHNIDQNVLLLGFLSPGDITLYHEVATTSAHISFATTTPLADGNYRLEAKMQRKFFFDWITIPGDDINQTISKQFIVGTPTFIGNLTQNGFNILNGTLASSTATSSVALVANCNPLGTFDMVNCLAGLFIPDASQVQATIVGAQQGILTRMPWGYVTRFVGIVGGTGTTTLSTTYTTTVALNTASDTTTLSFNPGDMFAGGATLVDSIESPYDNTVTFRSVFEPIIKLSIAVLVLLTIFSDITGSHSHHAEPGEVRRRRT